MVTRNSARHSAAEQTPTTGDRPILQVPALMVEAPVGTNPLLDGSPYTTLQHARMVLAFVRDWNYREAAFADQEEAEWGLSLVLSVIDDAVQHAMARIPTGDAQ
jgi:hypothetical protein